MEQTKVLLPASYFDIYGEPSWSREMIGSSQRHIQGQVVRKKRKRIGVKWDIDGEITWLNKNDVMFLPVAKSSGNSAVLDAREKRLSGQRING